MLQPNIHLYTSLLIISVTTLNSIYPKEWLQIYLFDSKSKLILFCIIFGKIIKAYPSTYLTTMGSWLICGNIHVLTLKIIGQRSLQIKSVLTVIIDAGYTFSSSINLGTFWIRPIAIMETSGELRSGEPNFPPIAPILLKLTVPPDTSRGERLLANANCCNRVRSFVIWNCRRNVLVKWTHYF